MVIYHLFTLLVDNSRTKRQRAVMSNRIMFVGSVLFASQVVLGNVLVTLPHPPQIRSQQQSSFEYEIVNALVLRGLEHEAAQKLVQDNVKCSQDALFLTHILATKFDIDAEKVYDYLASKVLFRKNIDLRAYDDVVAMVQQIKGISMQKEDLKAIEEYIAIV